MEPVSLSRIEAKTGLSRAGLPDPFFSCLYRSLAPYRGCAHACAYCDGRAERYFVEGDYGREIAVRENLPEMIRKSVEGGTALGEYGAIGMGSGVTDVYQPVEAELGISRQALEALVPTGLPIVILTKNALIMRDFDILAKFPKALVIVTVTTMDPALSGVLEPGASEPSERLEVVRRAREAGFLAGVMAMPLCPGLTDTPASTDRLFTACAESGAQFVYPGGLTLRPGRQKEHFLSVLSNNYPSLSSEYGDIYAENRKSGMPKLAAVQPLMRAWNRRLSEMNMACMIPHGIYRELLSPPDSLFVLLCHLDNLYSMRGVDTRPLRAATDRYASRLSAARTALRRKRIPHNPADPFPVTRILTEQLNELCLEGEALAETLGNAKLAALVSSIVRGNSVFDYPSLAERPE